MHVHILGICGTFMGGIAAIARAAGHRVTGSDRNVYPPMSTQLAALGIELTEGFAAAQLTPAPDVVVVGNVLSRGHPVIEALLESTIPYLSGPEWLSRVVLKDRWVLAVAGTHGKTSTSSLLAWILEYARLNPGFLIGGVPGNFSESARLGEAPFFVIEADEYDTAFFDKRAKFVHYRPRTLILNNLEFDHADIYPDLDSIERQFHHLVRIVPATGRIIANHADPALARVLAKGCWSTRENFGRQNPAGLAAELLAADGSAFSVIEQGKKLAEVNWPSLGMHSVDNALAAMAAARHVGVPLAVSAAALAEFKGVKRRMELRGVVAGVSVYDDFAHHPTAIATTVGGLRQRIGSTARLVAILEPRSNTMRMGVHKDTLAASFAAASDVWLYAPPDLGWDVGSIVASLGERGHVSQNLGDLAVQLAASLRAGDHALIMSNGAFGGLHQLLLEQLALRKG